MFHFLHFLPPSDLFEKSCIYIKMSLANNKNKEIGLAVPVLLEATVVPPLSFHPVVGPGWFVKSGCQASERSSKPTLTVNVFKTQPNTGKVTRVILLSIISVVTSCLLLYRWSRCGDSTQEERRMEQMGRQRWTSL